MIIFSIIILICVILDQASKYFAETFLSQIPTFPVIRNVFHLTYTQNTGAAFSMFSDKQIFLIILTGIFTLFLIILLWLIPKKKKYVLTNLALSLIISGAIGNLIDRVRLNYVVDFFDFRLISFAIFNVADVFVVCGCALLIFAILTNKIPENKNELNLPGRKGDPN